MWSRCLWAQQEFLLKRSFLLKTDNKVNLLKRGFKRSVLPLQAMDNDKFQLSTKYHGLEKNVWVEFVKIALEYQPLNLGQGLPDDLVPNYVIESLSEVLKDPNAALQQYTRGFGHPRLINAIANLYTQFLNKNTSPIDPQSQVLVTDGAYEALFCAIMGNVNPGDEVIIIEPYFDCYEPMVRLAGGIPKFIALAPHGKNPKEAMTSADWTLDTEELSAMFNDKTKAIIFNNPNNPLGKVFQQKEIEVIANLCKEHNVLVISDDVYEHMVFDQNKMIRMATLPEMWDRCVFRLTNI